MVFRAAGHRILPVCIIRAIRGKVPKRVGENVGASAPLRHSAHAGLGRPARTAALIGRGACTGHGEDRQLLFDLGALALGALDGGSVRRHDLLEFRTAIVTDILE